MNKDNIILIVMDTHKVSTTIVYIRAISREIVLRPRDIESRLSRVLA